MKLFGDYTSDQLANSAKNLLVGAIKGLRTDAEVAAEKQTLNVQIPTPAQKGEELLLPRVAQPGIPGLQELGAQISKPFESFDTAIEGAQAIKELPQVWHDEVVPIWKEAFRKPNEEEIARGAAVFGPIEDAVGAAGYSFTQPNFLSEGLKAAVTPFTQPNPISEFAKPVAEPVANWLTSPIKLDFGAGKVIEAQNQFSQASLPKTDNFLQGAWDKISNPAYIEYQQNKKETEDRATYVYKNFMETVKGEVEKIAQAPEKATTYREGAIDEIGREAFKAASLTVNTLLDLLERPARKIALPHYWNTMFNLGTFLRNGEITPEEFADNKDAAEYMAGGSTDFNWRLAELANIADPVTYFNKVWNVATELTETENAVRVKLKQKNPKLEALDRQEIFGIPVISVMDTITSYASGIGEAKIIPYLTALGLANNSKALVTGAKVLHTAEKTIYPMALTTLAAGQGWLGEPIKKFVDEESKLDPNFGQAMSVLSGVAVLSTFFKIVGKVSKVGKKASLLDQIGDFEKMYQQANTDPYVMKQMVDNFSEKFNQQVAVYKSQGAGYLTAEDLGVLFKQWDALPADIKGKMNDLTLGLFTQLASEGNTAGKYNRFSNELMLNTDTLKGGGKESGEVIYHEFAHAIEKGVMNDPVFGPMWKDLTKDVAFENVKGTNEPAMTTGEYKYANPGEYFAENFRMANKHPEVLKATDPEMYDFMSKVSQKIGDAVIGGDKVGEYMPRQIPESLKPLYEEAKKYKTAWEFLFSTVKNVNDLKGDVNYTPGRSITIKELNDITDPTIRENVKFLAKRYPDLDFSYSTNLKGGSGYISVTNPRLKYVSGSTDLFPVQIGIRISDHGGSWKYAGQERIELKYGDVINENQINELLKTRIDRFLTDDSNMTISKKQLKEELANSQLTDIWQKANGEEFMPRMGEVRVKDVQVVEEPLQSKPTSYREIDKPIEVVMINGKPVLVDGRHRLDQAIFNKQETIPAVISEGGTTKGISDAAYKKAFGDRALDFMPRMKPEGEINTQLADLNKVVDPEMAKRQMTTRGFTPDVVAKIVEMQDASGMGDYKVQTFDDFQKLALMYGTDPDGLVKMSQSGGAKVATYKNILNTNAKLIADLEASIVKGEITDVAKARATIVKANLAMDNALKEWRVGSTEAARWLVANKMVAQNTTDPAVWLYRAQQTLGDKEMTPELRKMIIELSRGKNQLMLAKVVSELKEPSMVQKLTTLWKAGLMFNFTTHERNFNSNVAIGILSSIKNIPAVALDKLVSIFSGQRTITLASAFDEIRGIPKGAVQAWDMITKGATEDDWGHAEIMNEINYKNPLANVITKTVYRTLGAGDKIFKARAFDLSMAKQAGAIALNEGLHGKEWAARKAEILADPVKALGTEGYTKITDTAYEDAGRDTFNNNTKLSKWLTQGKQNFPILDVVLPFVRTPLNVGIAAADYSPIGILRALIGAIRKPDQKVFVEEMGRSITGTFVMALGYKLAELGAFTGTYPTGDKAKKYKTEGLRGGDLIINGQQWNLMGISPVANLLQVGAEFYEAQKAGDDVFGATGQAAGALVGGLTDQTFLLGLSKFLNVFTKWDQGGPKLFAEGLSGGIIPSIVGQLAEASDRYQRDASGYLESIQNDIPGLRQYGIPGLVPGLPIKRDVTGKPLLTNQAATLGDMDNVLLRGFMRVLDPFNVKPVAKGVAIEEYKRLYDAGITDVYPAAIGRTQTFSSPVRTIISGGKKKVLYAKGSVKLTPAEYDKFTQTLGNILDASIQELMETRGYDSLTADEQASKIKTLREKALTKAKAIMGVELVNSHPEFKDDLLKQREEILRKYQ